MARHETIDGYARHRMGRGELLTWAFDPDENVVTFWVPEDVDEDTYPSDIDGARVVTHALPRPLSEPRWAG